MAEAKKKTTAPKGGFLDSLAGEGMQNVSTDDLQVPRLKLLQSLNPELDKTKPNFIEKASAGEFALTIPGVSLGEEVEVIPLHQATFWVEYLPGRGGFVGRHVPGTIPVDKSDFSNWFRLDTGNEIEETREWVVLVIGYEHVGPVLMSFTSTAIKASKSWLSMIAIERTPGGKPAPIFANVWKLSSVPMSNAKGSWFVVSSSPKKVRMISEKEFKETVDPARQITGTLQTQMLPEGKAQAAIPEQTGEAEDMNY